MTDAMDKKLDAIIEKIKTLEILPAMQKIVNEIQVDVTDLKQSLTYTQEEVKDLSKTLESLESRAQETEMRVGLCEAMKTQNRLLLDKITSLEDYSRRENLIFEGVPQRPGENCENLVYEILTDKLGLADARERIKFVRTHRLKAGPKGPPALITRFEHFQHKLEVWKQCTKLRNTNIWIRDDHPVSISRKIQALKPALKLARRDDNRAKIVGGTLMYRQRKYQISNLPNTLLPAYQQIDGNYCFFSGQGTPYSSLHRRSYELDGIKFSTLEQYYQYRKATDAGHIELANSILLEEDPVEQHNMGETLKADNNWLLDYGRQVMQTAIIAKFVQHADLREALLKQDKSFACCYRDQRWGTGLQFTHPDRLDPASWTGNNWLGDCFKAARDDLK